MISVVRVVHAAKRYLEAEEAWKRADDPSDGLVAELHESYDALAELLRA